MNARSAILRSLVEFFLNLKKNFFFTFFIYKNQRTECDPSQFGRTFLNFKKTFFLLFLFKKMDQQALNSVYN